ncbi:AraC-type DNA-binding protein [Variovorax sp. OV329]|nr:AraC-type DNA-binding protein [Variovorax sp. OV329]
MLLELVHQLAAEDSNSVDVERYRSMCMLTLSEMRRSQILPMGIVLPQDKRLRSFCESFLGNPTRNQSLDSLARESGASASTIARLFRKEIGTSFASWRQQVMLARALTLAAQRMPMSRIAMELGYSSASAFSVMFARLVGMAPSKFLSLDDQDTRR